MSIPLQITSDSVAQTLELGKTITQHLNGGQLIALIGPLGSGKTHLVKGLALGLDVATDEVHSPTFTLINEYEGKLLLVHIDAYRLDNPGQLAALGFDELCDNRSIVVVEWADLVWPLLKEYDPITIHLAHRSPTERTIEFTNVPKTLEQILQNLN